LLKQSISTMTATRRLKSDAEKEAIIKIPSEEFASESASVQKLPADY
jgi:hypothetical protein